MKTILAAALIGFLPAIASAQTQPADTKPAPFQPILAQDHEGLGRIGVRLAFDKLTGLPQIAAITQGSPAADFGLRVGDVLIKIDKNLTATLTQDEIRLALHGQPGTGVEFTIQRDDNPKFVVRAVERRVLLADAEDMVLPPMSEVAKPLDLLPPATPASAP